MRSTKIVAMALAAAGANIAGVNGSKVSGQVVTEEICLTTMGPWAQRHVPTYTQHDESLYTITKTHVQRTTKTVTPQPVVVTQTTTQVEFTTVAGQAPTDEIEVVSVTTTEITSTMSTVTSTVTSTTTSVTTSGTTSEVPTGAVFLPIQSSIPGLTNQGFQQHKREIEAVDKMARYVGGAIGRTRDLVKRAAKMARNCEESFPQKVHCEAMTLYPTIKTVTSHGQPQTVTAPTPIVISTQTQTQTLTSTTYGPTVTTSVTSTSTATLYAVTVPVVMATVSSTVSSTAYVATTTVYDMCAASNYGRNDQGEPVGNPSYTDSRDFAAPVTQASSATADDKSCCNLCAQNPLCQVGYYSYSSGTCLLYVGTTQTCSADNTGSGGPCTWQLELDEEQGADGTYFNGRAGQFQGVYTE